jgi:hypothetical protein
LLATICPTLSYPFRQVRKRVGEKVAERQPPPLDEPWNRRCLPERLSDMGAFDAPGEPGDPDIVLLPAWPDKDILEVIPRKRPTPSATRAKQ